MVRKPVSMVPYVHRGEMVVLPHMVVPLRGISRYADDITLSHEERVQYEQASNFWNWLLVAGLIGLASFIILTVGIWLQ